MDRHASKISTCTRVTTHRDGTTTRLLIDGDLDRSGATVVATYVHAELYRGVRLVLDVEGVTFLDAAALRTLSAAFEMARQRDASLTIANAHGDVLRAIELAGATFLLDRRLRRLLTSN